MEKKEFSSPARRYGKFFIAFIFITAGVLLLARNLGWISYTLFGILVSWQMLLILLGIYLMLRRQILRGGILLAIAALFFFPSSLIFWADIAVFFRLCFSQSLWLSRYFEHCISACGWE